jgi:hypothetical protein
MANGFIRQAIAELKTKPRWETPEQRLKRTGEAWPEDWAVYAVYEDNDGKKKWFSGCYCRERERMRKGKIPEMIVCATEAGPPPDDWRPMEKEVIDREKK